MIGQIIGLAVRSDRKRDMNQFTSHRTTSDFDGFATGQQPLVEVFDSRVEASCTEGCLVQDPAGAGMAAGSHPPVTSARGARMAGMGSQAQVGGQLPGIVAGGEATLPLYPIRSLSIYEGGRTNRQGSAYSGE